MMGNLKLKLFTCVASLMKIVALSGFTIMCNGGDYQPVVPEHMLEREE